LSFQSAILAALNSVGAAILRLPSLGSTLLPRFSSLSLGSFKDSHPKFSFFLLFLAILIVSRVLAILLGLARFFATLVLVPLSAACRAASRLIALFAASWSSLSVFSGLAAALVMFAARPPTLPISSVAPGKGREQRLIASSLSFLARFLLLAPTPGQPDPLPAWLDHARTVILRPTSELEAIFSIREETISEEAPPTPSRLPPGALTPSAAPEGSFFGWLLAMAGFVATSSLSACLEVFFVSVRIVLAYTLRVLLRPRVAAPLGACLLAACFGHLRWLFFPLRALRLFRITGIALSIQVAFKVSRWHLRTWLNI
jgi:hypothetical protein